MSLNPVAVIILLALLIDAAVHAAADILNLRQAEKPMPKAFEGYYDPDRYRMSMAYATANTRFSWVSTAFHLALFLGFWFAGGFAVLDQWVREFVVGDTAGCEVLRGVVFIGVLGLAKALVSLPFSVYSTFVIESRFGFNKTTLWVFVSDKVKQFFLAVAIGGPLLAGILAFFVYAGSLAWLYCWIAVALFMLVMQFVVPTWIMPLFNRFEPLAPGPLKSAIYEYARKIKFPVKNIYVMDGSKRSGKSNAFFAGFGRHRKIVLFDTLVENHTVEELVAVLAHEMGHYKKRHVFWMLGAAVAQAGLLFYLLSLFITSPMLAEAFFLEQASVYAGLVFFAILYSPIDMVISLIFQAVSRRNEHAADGFAAETTRNPGAMKTALKKLASHNLANLHPHWFYVLLNYSHPPITDRLEAIDRCAAGESS